MLSLLNSPYFMDGGDALRALACNLAKLVPSLTPPALTRCVFISSCHTPLHIAHSTHLAEVGLLVVGQYLVDVLRRAEEHGHALVHALAGGVLQRVDVKDALALGTHRRAARGLDDERHWRGLVQQPQLAVGILGVAGVAEDA